MRSYTQDQIQEALTSYQKRPSVLAVARLLKCDPTAAKSLLIELGAYQPPSLSTGIGNRKYAVNADYFKKIDSHEKAYFLGFLWADGCNHLHRGKCETSISLNVKDLSILEHFRDQLYPNQDKPIYISDRGKKGISATLSLRTKEIYNDLLALGMDQQKTVVSHIPPIEEEFIMTFALGYFDGDGCISLQKRPTQRDSLGFNVSANVDMVSNNVIMREFMALFKKRGLTFTFKPHRTPGYAHIYVCSYEKVRKFYDLVYASQKTFLTRKHDKFKEFFNYKSEMRLKTATWKPRTGEWSW